MAPPSASWTWRPARPALSSWAGCAADRRTGQSLTGRWGWEEVGSAATGRAASRRRSCSRCAARVEAAATAAAPIRVMPTPAAVFQGERETPGTGTWYMKQIYTYAYAPLCATILVLGAAGLLPRVGRSAKGEGTERRYFYGSVWAVVLAQTLLLAAWKTLPPTRTAAAIKLVVFVGALLLVARAAYRGALPRTRPIVPGESRS